MNNSTVNLTSEASTNSKYYSVVLINNVDIYMFSFNLLFGLPTHSYIIWLITTGTGSGVTSEFFNLNLSVCEIGICLNSLLSVIYYCTSCFISLVSFTLGLLITGRPLFQCLICVERYLAVVHPVTFLKYKPLRYRVICCTAIWIITLGSCVVCMFSLGLFYIYAWFFSVQFLLFLFIQLFCLVAVLRALKQSGPGERARQREEENDIKRRAFHIILIITISMTVIYVPFIISGLFFILTQAFIQKIFTVGLFCFILAGFVQPVLYLNRVGKLNKIFSCLDFLS